MQLAELEEVGHAAGLLEALVELVAAAEHVHVLPELLAQLGDALRAASCRPSSLRAMPQLSHISVPSSRWNESGVRLPLIDEQLVRCAP